MADAFSDEQKKAMQDINNEYHLEAAGEGSWDLYPIESHKFTHNLRELQPGEPDHSTFSFVSGLDHDFIEFIVTADGSSARNVTIGIDGRPDILLSVSLSNGEHLKYEGGNSASLFSSTWQHLQSIPIDASTLAISAGDHRIRFDAEAPVSPDAQIKFEVRLKGTAERITAE